METALLVLLGLAAGLGIAALGFYLARMRTAASDPQAEAAAAARVTSASLSSAPS